MLICDPGWQIKETMNNKTLKHLYAEHTGKVSDKWELYLTEYERIFAEHRDRPISLLEIGIQNGGSLEIWSKFFPAARKIVGCDINPKCKSLEYEDPRISIVVHDANSDRGRLEISSHAPTLDIVIDDGSHTSSDIIRSFISYFSSMSDGGIFIAEDLHCSYWREFQGGLQYKSSAIEFFKVLTDVINYEHWGLNRAPKDPLRRFEKKYRISISDKLLSHVHSIEFVNSMCIVRKLFPEQNLLGMRVVTGLVEDVAPGMISWNGSLSKPMPQPRWKVGRR